MCTESEMKRNADSSKNLTKKIMSKKLNAKVLEQVKLILLLREDIEKGPLLASWLAQLVECWTLNPRVEGLSPTLGGGSPKLFKFTISSHPS